MKWLILAFLIVVISVSLLPRIIKINKIICFSQFGPCSSYILTKLEEAQNKNLYQAKNYLRSVVSKEVYVANFTFRFKLPDKVEVHLIERKAEVALKRQNLDDFALVDRQGLVLAFQKNTTLPVIEVGGEIPSLGEKISQEYLFAALLVRALFASYGTKFVIIQNDHLEAHINSNRAEYSAYSKVIFPLMGDIESLVGSLELIFSRLNREDRGFIIDLRFRNPVIK